VSCGKDAVAVVASALLTQGAVLPFLSADNRGAVALGAGLAAANVLAAFAVAAWGLKRSPKAFLGAVLGGMMARMGLVLAAVAAAVVLFDVPKAPLALSLLAYFVPYLVSEIHVLHKSTPAPAGAI
jgi:hypothetical protein